MSFEWGGMLESPRTSTGRVPPVMVVLEKYDSDSLLSTRTLRLVVLRKAPAEAMTTVEDPMVI